MKRTNIGAIVLAAGQGSRIGMRPKCLLELDGAPIVQRLLHALDEVGVGPCVLVLGHHADAIEAALADVPRDALRIVRNPAPDDGPESSQRMGLAALPPTMGAVIVALADQPLIGAGELQDLIGAWNQRASGIEVLVPRVAGERGNPVLLGAAVCDAIVASTAPMGGRQWQRAHPDAVAFLDTDNMHYRVDIDTLEDIARFEILTGRALRWPAA